MGEYVININWSRGGSSSKTNTTPTSFLAGAAASAIVANDSFRNGGLADSAGIIERFNEKVYEPRKPFEFFFGRKK